MDNNNKEALFNRHRNTVEPLVLVDGRDATLQVIHTDAVNRVVNIYDINAVLNDRPISSLANRVSKRNILKLLIVRHIN